MINLVAVILAGGKSSRMGQDKATLPYKGKRLVDIVAEVIHAAGIKQIYISGELEGYNSIPDLMAARGPVGGICSSISWLAGKHSHALFIPVDMPCLQPELLILLSAQAPESGCYFEHHPLPCVLSLNKRTLHHTHAAAQALAQKKEVSVRDFLGGLNASAIPLPEALAQAMINTNTPQEWREATHESAH